MAVQATTFRSFVAEPFELAIGQPHQFLISSASVAIVSMEAATLVPYPANIALAVGAEWAYLRGLITGAGVKTRWAAALNWAAIILVFGYGGLWGLRSFHLIPEAPPWWVAVLLTVIHIGAIGFVTVCSAMLHRASMDAQAEEQKQAQHDADERKRRQEEAERAYQDELRRQRDAMQLEIEREYKKQQLAANAARVRLELRAAAREQAALAASGTQTNTDREQLREQVVRTLREQPEANKAALARSLGIGRTLLYELIAEAKQRGELEV